MPSKAPSGPSVLSRLHRGFVVGFAVWALTAGGLAVTTGAGGARAAAAGTTVPRPSWAACGGGLECASVPVPLDWHRPGGPSITLRVARHLASHPERRIGSLFFNPGGPGDSGVGAVAERGEALDSLTGGRFDVVGWDVRGSAGSAPVVCFANADERASFWEGLPVPTTRAEQRRYLVKTIALAQRCGARNGELLAHISVADTALDLDHLRRLVGDRQLTYLGESYGTLIGQTYANLFPGRVRAMALDGVVDPVAVAVGAGTEAVLASSLADTDRVFEEFTKACEAAGPDRCALAGHGPVAQRAKGVFERLRHTPLPAPSADPPGKLTYGEALTALKYVALPDPAVWPQLAALLEAAAEGDGSGIKSAAAGATSDQARVLLQEQGVALVCADSPARHSARHWPRVVRHLEAVSSFGGLVLGWVNAPCASWPAASSNRSTGPWHAATRNPVLLIGTRLDPNTPLGNARRAARRLGNAVLLTHDGFGHLSRRDPSRCVMRATGSSLIDLVTPRRGTVCPSDRLPFDPEFGQPVS